MKTCRFFKKTYCAWILIESARFPPFGFDITEISFNSNENMSFFQKGFEASRLCDLQVFGKKVKLDFNSLIRLWGEFEGDGGLLWDLFWHMRVTLDPFWGHFGATLGI